MASGSKGPGQDGTSSFKLPALDLNFGSLTEGTNIPPPPPSPKQEPKALPKIDENEEAAKQPKAKETNGASLGNGSSSNAPAQSVSRPPSRTASIMAEEKKSRRSSGWFRRLRSNDHASDPKPVATPPAQPVPESRKPAGPPPPMIPELSKLESKINTNLDAENLFKSIGRE